MLKKLNDPENKIAYGSGKTDPKIISGHSCMILNQMKEWGHVQQFGNNFGLLSAGRAYITDGGIIREYKELKIQEEREQKLDKINLKVQKWTIPVHIITIILTLAAIGISIWVLVKVSHTP